MKKTIGLEPAQQDLDKCPVCKGEPLPNEVVNDITFTNVICPFCYGKNDLDWIESVFGVDPSWRVENLMNIFKGFDF